MDPALGVVSLFTHLDDDELLYHHHLNHFANINFKNQSFNSTWVTLTAEHEPYTVGQKFTINRGGHHPIILKKEWALYALAALAVIFALLLIVFILKTYVFGKSSGEKYNIESLEEEGIKRKDLSL